MARRVATVSVSLSWWLAEGEEQCVHCGLPYLHELEIRCTDCDGPGCPHCEVLLQEGRAGCPACARAQCGAGERSGG